MNILHNNLRRRLRGIRYRSGRPEYQPWLAPAWIINDAVSMTRGKHTISFGGELRFAQNSAIFLGGQSGSFDFQRGETSLDTVGGSPIASFLLEQVDRGSAQFYTSTHIDARTKSFSLFIGDTWRVTPKLTISPGIHWKWIHRRWMLTTISPILIRRSPIPVRATSLALSLSPEVVQGAQAEDSLRILGTAGSRLASVWLMP